MPAHRPPRSRLAAVAAVAATLFGLVVAVGAPVGHADPGVQLLGIEVSSDQHAGGAAIGWGRVAATGARVAVVEATDGAGYRNPWFGADFYEARVAGLLRGSYAVGRPTTPVVTSATRQADYYLARLGAGATAIRTLPPMLDLETTGGLSQGQLITWTQTFLLRLQSRTGRTPILRTYGFFWQNALGASDAFGRYALVTATGVWTFPGVSAPVRTLAINTDDATVTAWTVGAAAGAWDVAVPGPPGSVRARPYDGAVTVSWRPGDTGSSAITGYRVLAEPGDVATSVAGDQTSATVTGLVDGTAYGFVVVATNAVGGGAPSPLTPAVTPSAALGPLPVAPVTPAQRPLYVSSCMPPSNLVRHTAWKRTHPSSGVTLLEGRHRDSKGRVQMHVLRIDVTSSHVRLAPLMRHVADHRKLSVLARRSRLVAATNAGYFDLSSGAPISPLIVHGNAAFGPTGISTVVGIGADGLMASGGVATSGTVTGHADVLPLAGWNAAQPAEGINAYSARWGTRPVPMPRDALSRRVSAGVVTTPPGRSAAAPTQGYLLVARGGIATRWLRALQVGDRVGVRAGTAAATRAAFSLAFGVGTHLVDNGVAATGLRCKRTERLPARTAIGWTADRRTLLLVAVDNNRRAKLHGLEPAQMARLMHDIGAAQAYLLDGGGSTEMIVRPRPGARLSIRNRPSDGVERKIPLGIGIFRS